MSSSELEREARSSPSFSLLNRLVRVTWRVIYLVLVRFSPIPMKKWRISIYKLFGAKVDWSANIYPSATVWLPSNLYLGKGSSIGPNTLIYNQGEVVIGDDVIISQGVHICASTHDYNSAFHPLLLAPIQVEDKVWICADAFVGPGVSLSEGSVVGARAVIAKKTESWTVYAGNPAVKV